MQKSAVCLLLALLAGGCCTLTRGSRQDVRLEAQPTDAKIQVNKCDYSGPVYLQLKRNETYFVCVSAPGYRPVEFKLRAKWDGLSLPSLLLPLGSLMTATDTASGADKAFCKLQKVTLQPTTDASEPPLQLREFLGELLTPEQYEVAVQAQRDRAALNSDAR